MTTEPRFTLEQLALFAPTVYTVEGRRLTLPKHAAAPTLTTAWHGRTRIVAKNCAHRLRQLAHQFNRTPAQLRAAWLTSKRSGERRTYPRFFRGMSTAEYVAAYEHAGLKHRGFFAALNTAPATLYEGGATDYTPELVEVEADQAEPAPTTAAPPHRVAEKAPPAAAAITPPPGSGDSTQPAPAAEDLNAHCGAAFARRVNMAAAYIGAGRKTSRAFDSCFEMWDGDAVCVALLRRTEKRPETGLARNLFRYLSRATVEAAASRQPQGITLSAWARMLAAQGGQSEPAPPSATTPHPIAETAPAPAPTPATDAQHQAAAPPSPDPAPTPAQPAADPPPPGSGDGRPPAAGAIIAPDSTQPAPAHENPPRHGRHSRRPGLLCAETRTRCSGRTIARGSGCRGHGWRPRPGAVPCRPHAVAAAPPGGAWRPARLPHPPPTG